MSRPSSSRASEGTAYCQVALPRPLRQTFVYRIPRSMRSEARPGCRVLVPFRRRKLVGCIDRLVREPGRKGIREVEELLDPEPLVPATLLRLCRWVAEYYVAPPGLVLRAALPPGLLAESSFRVSLGDGTEPDDGLDDLERHVVERLREARGALQARTLRREADAGALWPTLRSLARRGVVSVAEEPPETPEPGRRRQVIRLTRDLPTLLSREETFGRARRQREAYEELEAMGGRAVVSHMENRLGYSRSVLRGLEERGVAAIAEETVPRDPFRNLPAPEREFVEPTPRQRGVIDALRARAASEDPGVALVRGVTGSGKTFVYLELLEDVVDRRGRSAIVLVPEISLTPQTVQRFRAAFGDRIALLHSGLSPGERHDEWRALREGRKRIAIGARSAVFAPVGDLGAVVVDEEHESTYKQSDTPRYHARAVAAVRCRMEGALCVLGSATPSLESWSNALDGEYALHELPERATARTSLPAVELVDLRAERQERRTRAVAGDAGEEGGGGTDEPPPSPDLGPLVLSGVLREALSSCLSAGEQAILLLNRRGYSSFVQCDECGAVRTCRRCNVSLTFHRRRSRVVCHHCAYQEPAPDRCRECGARSLSFEGLGTEQVERRVGETFPDARIARMDLDTTGGRWAHFEILESVRRGEVDVLLGTQMIAKGLDFPNVTLVGVVDADVGLNLPDFRASERTFQLLTQVAGRAGRGERPGRVLVQTSRPRHFALERAAEHDYVGFAERELEERRAPGYPPHTRLANLVVSGDEETRVADHAAELADWLGGLAEARELEEVTLLGPAPCAIDRVRGRWRWHLLLKSGNAAVLGAVLRHLSDRKGQPAGDLRLEIDRDPEALL